MPLAGVLSEMAYGRTPAHAWVLRLASVWLGAQHLGLIDRPALLVTGVLALGSVFVAGGILVDVRREAIRL